MNIWDILILILVALALLGAVRLYRGRRKGKCGGCCEACGASDCRRQLSGSADGKKIR